MMTLRPFLTAIALVLVALLMASTSSAIAVNNTRTLVKRGIQTQNIHWASNRAYATPPVRNKKVYAHFMVGNTYSYTQQTWTDNIKLAQAYEIDGFALNVGRDDWQSARVANAYAAAKALGTGFELFISLDVTSLGCASAADGAKLRNWVTTYAKHSNQAFYKGKQLVGTFAGEYCYFGESTINDGWTKQFRTPLKNAGYNIHLIPSLFVDPSTFKSMTWIDGMLNWDSGWPMGGSNLDTSSDTRYINNLGGKTYMPAVSPCFFTYYGPNSWNKNWLYRSDNWLLATRWEKIISMRSQSDMVEVLTWNDYGESHYLGPIGVDQPNSQSWVNNFPHTAWLDVLAYYAYGYKTANWPTVTKDKIIIWSRPHPKAANPTAPTLARPRNWQYTDDTLYAFVLAVTDCQVTLTSGANTMTVNVKAGSSRLSITSAPGQISTSMSRNGKVVVQYASGSAFQYTNTPKDYNYNYFVASTP